MASALFQPLASRTHVSLIEASSVDSMRIEWAIIVGLSASARANLRTSSRLSKSPEGWARMVGGVLGPDGLSKNWIVNFIPDHIAGASYYASFSLGRLFKLRHSPRAASSASDLSLSLFPRDVRPRRLAAPNESPVSALARWPDTPMLAQAESAFRRFSRLRSDF